MEQTVFVVYRTKVDVPEVVEDKEQWARDLVKGALSLLGSRHTVGNLELVAEGILDGAVPVQIPGSMEILGG